MIIAPVNNTGSAYLISYIRNRLKDLEKKLVDNDQILYDRLTFYQSFVILKFPILRIDDNFPLYNNEVINSKTGPIIPSSLHFLLCDCVLSEFIYVNKSFFPLDVVLKEMAVVVEKLPINNQVTDNLSRQLIYRIRQRLGDVLREIVSNDAVLYDRLTYYQTYLLNHFAILRVEVEFPLYKDQQNYPVDDFISKVVDFSCNNPSLDIWFNDTTNDDRYFIINNKESVNVDDQIVLTCNLKTVDEIIDVNNMPILPLDYHNFLVDCVLSEYAYIKPFAPLTFVLSEVKSFVNRQQINNVRPKKYFKSLW